MSNIIVVGNTKEGATPAAAPVPRTLTKATVNDFRIYEKGTSVARQYETMRSKQTYEFGKRMKKQNLERLELGGRKMDVLEAMDKLDDMVDQSDPDIALGNLHHLYQTAEGARADSQPDWMQLTGLIHDLGKMMYLWGRDEDGTTMTTQWGLVGDTYVLGARLRNTHVFPEFDALCPDMKDEKMKTDVGVYSKGCGMSNLVMAWGHDEYLYDTLHFNVALGNVTKDFPTPAYYCIRFHSCYPWHRFGEYTEFEDEQDRENKPWVQKFNEYDLYTKENKRADVDALKDYYRGIIRKYFPTGSLVF